MNEVVDGLSRFLVFKVNVDNYRKIGTAFVKRIYSILALIPLNFSPIVSRRDKFRGILHRRFPAETNSIEFLPADFPTRQTPQNSSRQVFRRDKIRRILVSGFSGEANSMAFFTDTKFPR